MLGAGLADVLAFVVDDDVIVVRRETRGVEIRLFPVDRLDTGAPASSC